MRIKLKTGKDIWINLLYKSIILIIVILIFFYLVKRENPPEFILEFLFIPIIIFCFLFILNGIIRRLFYKLEVAIDSKITIIESIIFSKRYDLDASAKFRKIIPTSKFARYRFIRVNDNYDLEFGSFLGSENTRIFFTFLEENNLFQDKRSRYESSIGVVEEIIDDVVKVNKP